MAGPRGGAAHAKGMEGRGKTKTTRAQTNLALFFRRNVTVITKKLKGALLPHGAALRHCRSENRARRDVRGCNQQEAKTGIWMCVEVGVSERRCRQPHWLSPHTACITSLTEGISSHLRVLLSLPLHYYLRSPGRVEIVSQRRHLHTIEKTAARQMTERATSKRKHKKNVPSPQDSLTSCVRKILA